MKVETVRKSKQAVTKAKIHGVLDLWEASILAEVNIKRAE
jgi:hypothetical protein